MTYSEIFYLLHTTENCYNSVTKIKYYYYYTVTSLLALFLIINIIKLSNIYRLYLILVWMKINFWLKLLDLNMWLINSIKIYHYHILIKQGSMILLFISGLWNKCSAFEEVTLEVYFSQHVIKDKKYN